MIGHWEVWGPKAKIFNDIPSTASPPAVSRFAMLSKKGSLLIPFLVALILCWSNNAHAGQKQKLPRYFGPLYLGMSVKEFKKIVDVSIGRCVHCAEDELQADLYISKRMTEHYSWNLKKPLKPIKLKDAYIKFQPRELQPELVTCLFYKNVLYRIIMSDVEDKLDSVRSRYVKALGKPTAVDVWDTGLSQLRWENSSTFLSVVYSTKEVGIDVLEIAYTDLKIMKKIPKNE